MHVLYDVALPLKNEISLAWKIATCTTSLGFLGGAYKYTNEQGHNQKLKTIIQTSKLI
jgi:hypothetical protein